MGAVVPLSAWLIRRDIRKWTPERWCRLDWHGHGVVGHVSTPVVVTSRVGLTVAGGAQFTDVDVQWVYQLLTSVHVFGIRRGAAADWLDDLHILVWPSVRALPIRLARRSHTAGAVYERVPKYTSLWRRFGIYMWDDWRGLNGLVHELLQHHLPNKLGHGRNDEEDARWVEVQTDFEEEFGRALGLPRRPPVAA